MNLYWIAAALKNFGAEQLNIYTIQNCIEIGLISFMIAHVLTWMSLNHNIKIIYTMYAYSLCLAVSYFAHLPNIHIWLWLSCPIIVIAIIMLEQKQIQKNFILPSIKLFQVNNLASSNWINLLIQSQLIATYQNKEIFYILENRDDINSLLRSNIQLNTPINSEAIHFIINNNQLINPTIITINNNGAFHLINAQPQKDILEIIPPNQLQNFHYLMKIISCKTDALIWTINPQSKAISMWRNNTILQGINIDQLIGLCEKNSFNKQKGVNNDCKSNQNHHASNMD